MPGNVPLRCHIWLNGGGSWRSLRVWICKVWRRRRLMLQRYVGTPQSIVTDALAVWLPDVVGVWLNVVHLVPIESVRDGSYVVWMTNGESTLWIPRGNRWRTSNGFPHGIGFTLNVETIFVRCRRIDLIQLLLVCVRIRRVEEVRHIG
uniref:(northern house mosquito) hypothetical protein n=1 Tax=Culex pipiens TaxID=7175 RepID=A0A8D8DG11_CULPI